MAKVNLTIKTKLTIGITVLAVFSTLAASIGIGLLSISESKNAVEEQVLDKLISTRENKKSAIESYFTRINNHALTFANDRMIIDGMFDLKYEISERRSSKIDIDAKRQKLKQYYEQEFAKEYKNKNVTSLKDPVSLVDELDDYAVDMQFQYISNNNHPLGEKGSLDKAEDFTQYSTHHKTYHPHIRDYAEKFGFDDILLVDSDTGHVVYSVSKEIDYATYLTDGAFADSGLGKAFKGANQLEEPGTVIEDFSPYFASYDDFESFIAAPIFDDGKKIGVLIIKVPRSGINKVMTNNEQWKETGMGDSGETFIVGDDFKMRSASRFLIEDKTGYLDELKKEGVSKEIIDLIAVKDSSVGLQLVTADGAKLALAGKTGEATFQDHRHIDVLLAYAPLNIEGLNWGMLSKIDAEEAFQPAKDLQFEIIKTSLIVIAILSVIAGFLGLLISKSVLNPIQSFSDSIKAIISRNEINLTKRIPEDGEDEFALLAADINSMLSKNQKAVLQIVSSSVELQSTASKLMSSASQTKADVDKQREQTEIIAGSLKTVSAMVEEIVANVAKTTEEANARNEDAKEGSRVVNKTIEAINYLSTNISQTTEVVGNLEQQSNAIGSVLDVIRAIAEQTNLLALNAAIEAARAGDQGRGFAVVADEVRTLASRTQDATEEIQKMIELLQNGAKNSADVMTKTNQHANDASEMAIKGNDALTAMSSMMDDVKAMTHEIERSTKEQANATAGINESVGTIGIYAEKTQVASSESMSQCAELQALSRKMDSIVKVFIV
jgi:methyl-accepting chemotaxis protein